MSFPRYPAYKPSGVEWLGEVPAHWLIQRLKRVARAFPSNVDKKSAEGEASIKLCNYTDVYYHDKIVHDMDFMSATATDAQVQQFTLRRGDVIITKDSETADDIAVAAYVPEDLPGVVCGYHLTMIRPTSRASGLFIKWLFGSSFVRSRFEVSANGLTRVGLGQYAIDNVDLPIPPIKEQNSITAFLDHETTKIDALIAEQERLIALLAEKRQAMISHAVTKGLNPDVPMKDSGNGSIGFVPSHWAAVRLKSMFRQEKRTDNPHLQVLSVYRDFGVIPKSARDDNHNKTPEDVSAYQLVRRGDLVVNKMKAWQGSLGISNDEGITSPDYAVFSPSHTQLPRYLHHLLRSRSMVSTYRGISSGIRLEQWRLEPDAFLSLHVHLPPLEDQSEIVAALDELEAAYEKLAAEVQRAIELLRERRSALISAAVTGQIDVRGAMEPAS